MPIYEYQCSNANCETDTFETHQSYRDDALTDCPFCGENSVHRVMSLMHIGTKNYNTLGALVDRNREKMGRYKYEETVQKMAEERMTANEFVGKLPTGGKVGTKTKSNRSVDLSLAKMNKEQTKRYIETGKKPI